MKLRDKEGRVRIKFSDFKRQYDDEPIFIDAMVEVITSNSSAKEAITVELTDLTKFLHNLKTLNETLKQTFYFQHIDEQLQLKFEPLDTGNISVTGFLKDKLYMNSLQFTFEMPPTELSLLIRQSENIIDVLIK